MTESAPPPIYSQQDPTVPIERELLPEPQILISPTVDAINFQKGYLGAEGERAAIEGELQIKGAEPGRWHRMYVLESCRQCQCLFVMQNHVFADCGERIRSRDRTRKVGSRSIFQLALQRIHLAIIHLIRSPTHARFTPVHSHCQLVSYSFSDSYSAPDR